MARPAARSRSELKRSVEEGEDRIYMASAKKSASLNDVLALESRALDDFVQASAFVGKGIFGQVMALQNEEGARIGVLKRTECDKIYLGDFVKSPFRSENSEPLMLRFLWENFSNVTPHLVAPLGDRSAVVKKVKSRAHIFCMESSTYSGNALTYLRSRGGTGLDAQFMIICFQVCYTLACIHIRCPGFKHGDLHTENVLINKEESPDAMSYTEYRIHGQTFYLPNRYGITALLADYGYSCVPGYIDNYRTLEIEYSEPRTCVNARLDQSSDIVRFITYTRAHIAPFLGAQTNTLFNQMTGFPTTDHPTPSGHQSAGHLLHSSALFDRFKRPPPSGTVISARYDADVQWGVVAPLAMPAWPQAEFRHCPLILPIDTTKRRRLWELPSFQYLMTRCAPIALQTDAGRNEPYDKVACRAILNRIERSPFLAEHYVPVDPGLCDLAWDIAITFIQTHHVPIMWWYAVFTCAVNDAYYKIARFPRKKKKGCACIELWVSFWKRTDVIEYTDIGLLQFALQWAWLREL